MLHAKSVHDDFKPWRKSLIFMSQNTLRWPKGGIECFNSIPRRDALHLTLCSFRTHGEHL